MSVKNKFKENDAYIRFLHRAIIGLIVSLGIFGFAFFRMPERIVVFSAPDLNRVFEQKANEIPRHAVYGFARTIWEVINYCEKDCREEYPERLQRYSAYISRNCLADLENHFNTNRELYAYRNRVLLPTENAMYHEDMVQELSRDAWQVSLEYILKDEVGGSVTRYNKVRYPLRIIRSDRPLDTNPFGMEVDCFFGTGAETLERFEIAEDEQ